MKQPTRTQSNAATFAALIGLIVIALGLLALVAIVFPQALGLVVVVAGIFLFVTFHYLVWGWWLTRARRDEEEWPAEEDAF